MIDTGAEPRLTIDRLACRIRLPAGLDDPGAARDKLERLARRELSGACGARLAALPEDDEAVYRIRHLHLELWLDLQGTSEQEIVERWGRLLAAGVVRAMQRGGASQVVRFPSARHFVTAFLRDLVDGGAWGRWYFAEFHPLERLSVGAIAAELLAARPGWIVPTLTELAATGHAERLIERWQSEDVERLWTALRLPAQPALTPAGVETERAFVELAGLWASVALSGRSEAAARWRDRLRLWLALAAAWPEAAREPTLASLVNLAVDLGALLRAEPDLAPALLMESGLYPAALRRVAAGPLVDAVGWLTSLSATDPGRALLARAARIVGPPGGQRAHPSRPDGLTSSDADSRRAVGALSSPVGSVFLVAPALVETGLWERWRDECGEGAARRYLFVLALKVLGRDRAPLLLGDPALAAFAGLDEPPVADVRLPRGAASGRPEEAGAAHAWAAELPELAARWHPVRERALTFGIAQGVEVVRDANADLWLAARPTEPEPSDPHPLARRTAPAADFSAIRRDLTPEEQEVLVAEAKHLQLGQGLGYPWLTPHLDAALSVVASLVLRRTAGRLPGFARASPTYLARQFLAQPATLRFGPQVLEARLSGGPLAVVLRLAALPEALEVPWLPLSLRLTLPGPLGNGG